MAYEPSHRIELTHSGAVSRVASAAVPDTFISLPGPELFFRDEDGGRHRIGKSGFVSAERQESGTRCRYDSSMGLILILDWSLDSKADAVVLRSRIVNEGTQAAYLDLFRPLIVSSSTGGSLSVGQDFLWCSFLKNGWQSWSATENLGVLERDVSPMLKVLRVTQENPLNPASGEAGELVSEMVGYLENQKAGSAMVIGFSTTGRFFADVRLCTGTTNNPKIELSAECRFDGIALGPGEEIEGEDLFLKIGRHEDDLPSQYARFAGHAMCARIPESNPAGWCSWYYYYNRVSEADIEANLDALDRLRDRIRVDYVQIDDGYQAAIGDWLSTNKKFPSGMAALARKISDRGFAPGIWTAPFIVRPDSTVCKEHRDWLLTDEAGKPVSAGLNPLWGGGFFALDVTHPEVGTWLRSTFETMHRDWGYRFFKIDFLYAAALPAGRHDASLTRAGALRKGLEIVRQSVGDSFILGCGCPLGPAIGVVDGMRIGPDVAPFWKPEWYRAIFRDKNTLCALHAIRNTINRYFTHRAFWQNDPDCLLVRKDRSKLSLNEVRSLASVILLSGGMTLLSDDLTRLSEDRIEIIETVLRLSGNGMVPLDYTMSSFPAFLLSERRDGALVGLLNYSRRTQSRSIDLESVLGAEKLARVESIEEVWTKKLLSARNGHVILEGIPGHGCALVNIGLRPEG